LLLHGLLLLGCPRSLYLGVLDGLLRCGLGLGLGRRLGLGLRCGLLLGCLGSLLGRGLLLGLGLGGLPGGYLGLLRRLHLRLLRWQILTVSHNNLLRCALYNKSSVLHYTRKCVSEGFLARLVYIIEDDLTATSDDMSQLLDMVFSPDDTILIGGSETPSYNLDNEEMLGEALPPRSYQRNLEELDALLGSVGNFGFGVMSPSPSDDEDDED